MVKKAWKKSILPVRMVKPGNFISKALYRWENLWIGSAARRGAGFSAPPYFFELTIRHDIIAAFIHAMMPSQNRLDPRFGTVASRLRRTRMRVHADSGVNQACLPYRI
jgi:hypothetical protein